MVTGQPKSFLVQAMAIGTTAIVMLSAGVTPASAAIAATPIATWTPRVGRVYAVVRIGSTVVIGGTFTSLWSPNGATTVTRNRLAAFDAGTGALLPWNPGADDVVRALEPSADGQGVYVGGSFTTIGTVARARLALVNLTSGAVSTTFAPKPGGTVLAVERVGGTVVLGGYFNTVNSATRTKLAAVDAATGALLPGWAGGADGAVYALQAGPDGQSVYVGGQFRTLAGQSRDYLGSVATLTGATTSWRPAAACSDVTNPCYVLDLAVGDTAVYAGIGGPGGRVTSYDPQTARRLWQTTTDGDVQAVTLAGGTLVAGGHFEAEFGGKPRAGIAALDAVTGGVLDGWGPSLLFDYGVWDLGAEAGYLRVGGGFTRVDADATRQRYSAFAVEPDPADGTPPGQLTGLAASLLRDTRVTLSWAAGTDDRGVSGYRVSRDGVAVAVLGGTSWVDRDLLPDTSHSYRVEARDVAGNWSTPSAALAVRTTPASTSLITPQGSWRYLSDGLDAGTAWRATSFDDSTWSVGDAELGYGDGDEATSVSARGLTSYFRRTFGVADPSAIAGLTLLLQRDDGALVYLNGVEVARSNMPAGAVTAATPAASDVSGSAEKAFVSLPVPVSALQAGTNVLAVEVHNATGSSDLSFDAELVPTAVAGAGTLVAAGDAWRWLDGRGSAQPAGWMLPATDDSSWSSGAAELGFGDGDEVTLLPSGAVTYYLRRSFTLADPSGVSALRLRLLRDDGAAVYVNGIEVLRSNLPAGTLTASTLASTAISGAGETTWVEASVPVSVLRAGTNTVAVEVHQATASSSDATFNLSLTAS
jgi:chitodextrinase